MKKIIASLLALSLFAASCQLTNPTQTPTPPPTEPAWDNREIYKDGLVPSAQPILKGLKGASVYHLNFNLADNLTHITGNEKVRYTNTEDRELKEVRLHLFSNILGGEMTTSNITVDDKTVTPAYDLNNSLLIVPFPQPLAVGQNTIINMDFTVTVPDTLDSSYGMQAYFDNVLSLAHVYPMIAVFDDEGWNAEIPPQYGDITYADMSFFVVNVDAPKTVTLASSGRELNHAEDGNRQTVTYEAGPVRDFYLAASPEYKVTTRESNGITYRFYTRPSLKAGAEVALNAALNAVEDFSQRYAPYPYSELDFVSTPTLAFGIEYPGMIAISERIIEPNSQYLEATIAHEVSHQWFYNLVGNDQLDDPWLDESLAQYATLQYFGDEYGPGGYRGFHQSLESRWARVNNADIPVGMPVREYSDAEYGAIVYGRGPLFFEALGAKIGTEAFDAFLKDYTETNAWSISTPEKLKAIAEKHCSCDLTSLFDEWIY